MEMTKREVEEDVVDVEVDQEEEKEVEVTLRLATGKKSMSSPPAPRALSALARLNPLLPPQGKIKELEYTTPRRVYARAARRCSCEQAQASASTIASASVYIPRACSLSL